MIHPIRRTKATIGALKAAFRLSIATFENLTRAIENNTIKVDTLSAEQTELRKKFDTLVDHSQFFVLEKLKELQRAGHHIV